MNVLDVIYVEDDEQEALIMKIGMRRFEINILHIPFITVDTLSKLGEPPYQTAVAVLFDEMLAGESGIKLSRTLRDNGDERLIFLLTAGENPDPALLTTQTILFRRKPVDFEELATTIRKLSSL